MMKKLLTLLLICLTLLVNAQSGMLNGSGYAPDITVTDINGNTHNLYNYLDSGKVVVLELMSTTCGHCQSHAAGTENSYQTNGPSGTNVARFLGLEVNAATDSAAVANFASTYGVTFPIANNISPTAINYQLYYTPGYYVIYPDRSYTTICALYCVTAQNYSTIEGLLNTAIAAWVPPVYGCTDSLALNYDPLATADDGSCQYNNPGCNGRYQTEIFSSVSVTTVNYSDVYTDNAHEMDIYTPDGDTEINRPVILYMHGGSFYAGDKINTDCVDFCESMAKRGYVVASLNYRLANIISFLTSNATQYETILKAVFDAKSAIRYFRKDFSNGDTYGIDTSTIFVGGSSAGGIIAVHLAYIDSISDLPTTPDDIQAIANSLGGLEGDAGNLGYSSEVNGVISFAGGINTLSWIDANDEPIVSCQGDADQTVNYNCGPGLGNTSVITLCGAGEIHPRADSVGVLNDKLIFLGEGHTWFFGGNSNPLFLQALDFTKDFLYPLLPCQSSTVYGCTDATACNYDPLADFDDGSCEWTSCNPTTCAEDPPTGIYSSNIAHNRVTINWDNMNDSNCFVDQYRISYSDDGGATWANKTMGQPVASCVWPCQKTDKLILNLTPSTTYTYRMKTWYCGGGNSAWSANYTFTTEADCPNVGNLAVSTPSTTKATFTWDDSNGAYSFVRIIMRADTTGGTTWFNVGGSGVNYGIFTKDKNNLTPGMSYRGQARTWCDPNGGAWKSTGWTSLLFWTQPTAIRLEGGTAIANLEVYPNPSRDIFNVSFASEDVQDLKVRILNVVGEELINEDLQQFVGEYTKQIDLSNNAKGIYFLEITTNNGVINKKLIFQ